MAGDLHPDLGAVSTRPIENKWSTRPLQDWPAPAVRRQRLRRHRSTHLLRRRRVYESEDGVFPAALTSRRIPSRSALGSVPANQLRPNALERVSLRANLGANVGEEFRPAGNGRVTCRSDTRVTENDNSALTVTGSAETSINNPPYDILDGWYFTPAQLFAKLANQGGRAGSPAASPATGGPRSWLTDPGDNDRLRRRQPDRRAVLAHRRGGGVKLGGIAPASRIDNRFDISQTSVDVAASARFRLSRGVGVRDVGGRPVLPRFRPRELRVRSRASGRPGRLPARAPLRRATRSWSRVRSARTWKRRST